MISPSVGDDTDASHESGGSRTFVERVVAMATTTTAFAESFAGLAAACSEALRLRPTPRPTGADFHGEGDVELRAASQGDRSASSRGSPKTI